MATYAKYILPGEAHARIVPIATPFGREDEALAAARARIGAQLAA
jgi:hypothetical protein